MARESEKIQAPDDVARTPRISGRSVIAGVVALLVTILLTLFIAPTLGWRPGIGEVSTEPASVFMATMGALTLSLALRQIVDGLPGRPAHGEGRAPVLNVHSLSVMFIGCAILVAAGMLPWVKDPAFHRIAGLQALIIATFTVVSVLGNGLRLHLVRVGGITAGLGLFAGAANFAVIYWALTEGVGSPDGIVGIWPSLLSTAAVMGLVLLVTITATATAYACGPKRYLTQYTPVTSAAREMFLVSLLWLVFAWFPQIVAEHIPRDDSYHLLKVLILILPITLLSGAVMFRVMDARVKTLSRRILTYVGGPHRSRRGHRRHDLVDGHAAVQDALALLLMATTLVGALPALLQLSRDFAHRDRAE